METHWNFNSFNLVNLIYSANITEKKKCDLEHFLKNQCRLSSTSAENKNIKPAG